MLGKKTDTSGEGVQLSLVITPFLDVAFQLMAFFVMVYNPAPTETHFDGKLLPYAKADKPPPPPTPKIGNKDKKDDEPPKIDEEPKIEAPKDKEPDEKELKTNLRIIIKAVGEADGLPKAKEKEEVDIGFRDGEPKEITLHLPGVAQREATAIWVPPPPEPLKPGDGKKRFEQSLAPLLTKLKEIRDGPGGAEVTVSIDPAPNLKYEYFIRMYDVCKTAKFKEINFHAPQKVP
ncbi:MAG TPA: hypothetical protein VEL76_32940 [Gemmataceae bacterium]|nr:hypothetical protein [Gemmataceae bacterium]